MEIIHPQCPSTVYCIHISPQRIRVARRVIATWQATPRASLHVQVMHTIDIFMRVQNAVIQYYSDIHSHRDPTLKLAAWYCIMPLGICNYEEIQFMHARKTLYWFHNDHWFGSSNSWAIFQWELYLYDLSHASFHPAVITDSIYCIRWVGAVANRIMFSKEKRGADFYIMRGGIWKWNIARAVIFFLAIRTVFSSWQCQKPLWFHPAFGPYIWCLSRCHKRVTSYLMCLSDK